VTAASAIALTSPLTALPGIGPRTAEKLHGLGVRCIADLLRHLPLRHEHELAEDTIHAAQRIVGPLHGAEANVAASGDLGAVALGRGRQPRVEATIMDGTGTMRLVWFNAPYMKRSLHPGLRVRVEGKAKRWGDYLEMANPRLTVLEAGAAAGPRIERYRAVYPATEGVSSSAIEKAIAAALPLAMPLLEDHLPADFRERRALPSFADAFRMIHAPANPDEAASARRRLAYDELLLLQLGVMMRRRQLRERFTADPLACTPEIDRHITRRLPFALTPDQRAVIDEIAADCARTSPMNRLLQGDVGAGKTVVALHAMLLAVASRHQAALMAPTELLAEQHATTIRRLLSESKVRLALLTGALTARERRETTAAIEAGEVDLVIGTHAILTESVKFKSLALVVIDEQHRFGVHQRATLRDKRGESDRVPHVLVMTATPIPRTLSLTVFGDLDISTIRHLPPGRQPIATRVVGPEKAPEVYSYAAERIRAGEQAYVVVPSIEEGDRGLKDVVSHMAWLSNGPFAGLRVAGIHGRLPVAERDEAMDRFRGGSLDVLVATVVIEVGVDVPNASLMIVEHAERFGLAQLHQLRGRIGRGTRRSLCVLIGAPGNPEAEQRLAAIAETTDGFRIAERDLEIRGPGELFGARQAGAAPFLAADLPRDFPLLAMARRDAEEWIGRSPALAAPEEAVLKRRLMKAHGKALGLADVG